MYIPVAHHDGGFCKVVCLLRREHLNLASPTHRPIQVVDDFVVVSIGYYDRDPVEKNLRETRQISAFDKLFMAFFGLFRSRVG